MGEQVKEIYNWARRRKIMAAFLLLDAVGGNHDRLGRFRAGVGDEEHVVCGNQRDAAGGARSDSFF